MVHSEEFYSKAFFYVFCVGIAGSILICCAMLIIGFLIKRSERWRRGRFLDSLRYKSIEEIRTVGSEIGVLIEPSGEINLMCFPFWNYPADSLGRFVESLLNDFPTEENYRRVADLIYIMNRRYGSHFLNTFGRHKEIADELREMVLEDQMRKRDKEIMERKDERFKKGLALCELSKPKTKDK